MTGTTASGADERSGPAREAAWSALAVVTTIAAYTFVFARNRRFFFTDDLQHTLLATIYELGRQLRRGVWPMVQHRTWHSSFVVGDPQYGLFNPVTLLSYALVSGEHDVPRGAFLLAAVYACLIAAGGYVACRAAGVRRSLAALGGATLATAPYVLYWNAATWHMGLVGYCWFVWAVAALLLTRRRPQHGWLLAAPTYLVFTSGWPATLVALGACYASVGAWDVWVRRVPLRAYVPAALGVAAGALAGLAPWVVSSEYLPIARRAAFWENNGMLTMHLEGLAGMFSPVARPVMLGYGGTRVAHQPITFASVLVLTAVVLHLLHRRRSLPDTTLVMAAVVLLLLTLGPTHVGPMRYPVRFLPFGLALALIAALVVVSRASRLRLPPTPARGFAALAGLGLLLVWLCFTQRPIPKIVGYNVTVIAFAGVLLVALLERGRAALAIGFAWAAAVAAFVLVVTTKPTMDEVADWGAPARIEEMEEDARVMDGRRTVLLMRHLDPVAGPTIRDIPSGSYSLFSRTAGPLIGGYSPLPLRRMSNAVFCAADFGWTTCPDVVDRLFAVEPRTGARHVDLLGATQILVQHGDLASALAARAPAGWHREAPGRHLDRWTRDEVVTLPGDVSWASPGVTIRPATDGVAEVAAPQGGMLVFARPWLPGMRVALDGRRLPAGRLWGLYARVHLPPGASGRIRVDYALPGRGKIAILVACAVVLLAASVLAGRRVRAA